MPATTFAPTAATRTCPHPDHEGARTLAFTAENFYIRPNGNADYWCRECVRRYNRQNRAARRARGEHRTVTARKFGVEIEYIGDNYSVAAEMRDRGLSVSVEGYNHRVSTGWKIVTDSSVMSGYELVSPPLSGQDGFRQLKLACESLAAARARVNRSCGLHVHHDVNDLNTTAFGRLFRAWSNNQANTDGLVAASRRSSNWCRPLRADEVERAESLPSVDRDAARRHFSYVDRYRSLNVAAFPRYGTVEIRQHQGSLSFEKIAAWVSFGQAFVAWAKSDADIARQADTATLVDTLAAHGLDAAKVTFLKARAAHFAGSPVAA